MKEYSGILVVVCRFFLFVCLLLYFTHTPRPAPFMKGLASKTNKLKA